MTLIYIVYTTCLTVWNDSPVESQGLSVRHCPNSTGHRGKDDMGWPERAPRPHRPYSVELVTLIDWQWSDSCIVCSWHFFLLIGGDNIFFYRELMIKLDILCEGSLPLLSQCFPHWGERQKPARSREISSILCHACASQAFCKPSN